VRGEVVAWWVVDNSSGGWRGDGEVGLVRQPELGAGDRWCV
jgi:hypothetical protein